MDALAGRGSGTEDRARLVAVVVVAFEAERTIEHVLRRIPEVVAGLPPIVLVADDASGDSTMQRAAEVTHDRPEVRWLLERRPRNLGYGGNQKLAYQWATSSGAEIVVLLHGDDQYDPAAVHGLIRPLLDGHADAVLGSRMSVPGAARAGGMPVARRLGNRCLSTLQNFVSEQRLSEWHSGYRAYTVDALRAVDIDALPDGFDFDTALMFELIRRGRRIGETPIRTRYADEKSRVKLVRFGLQVVHQSLRHWCVHGEPLSRPSRSGVGEHHGSRASGP